MSDLLQSANHPDADQLNAFVEHALPAHERDEMLAHLAICADCRSIVALSMPPFEETLPDARRIRRPWLSGWRRLWPVAAAGTLAALVLVSIHIRNLSIADTNAVRSQVSQSSPPPPLPSSDRPAAESKQEKSVAPGQPRQKVPIRPQEHASAPLPPLLRAPSPPLLPSATAAPNAGVISADSAAVAINRHVAATPQPQDVQSASSAAPVQASPPAPVGQNQQAMGARMMSPSASAPATSADISSGVAPDLAHAILRMHPLPSGLPALSIVLDSRHNQTLAVDTHGALFLTADFGQHWKSIATQWPGRAVKVDLTYSESMHKAGLYGLASAAKAGSQFATEASSVGGPAIVSSGALPAILRGTVTDAAGATIPGATVIVSATPAQLARMAKTDARGSYLIDSLAPGTYRIEASYPGFIPQQLAGVVVAPGKPSQANLTLPIGAQNETVEVSSASSQIALDERQAKLKTAAPRASSIKTAPSAPVFEITTDNDEHWVSSDGLVWKRK